MVMRIVAAITLASLGLFVFLYQRQANKPADPPESTKAPEFSKEGVEAEGVKPDVPPEFDVQVELRMEGPRQVLDFTITERHGWYADLLRVEFWYVEQKEDGQWRQVGDPLSYQCHHYLDFGATLVEHTTPQAIEFPELDDFGTTENWRARISSWDKVLAPKTD